MSRNFKLSEKFFIMLFPMAFAIVGCVQSVSTSNFVNTTTVSDTATIAPSNITSMSPTSTYLVTEIALTLTLQADERQESYLLPSDIDGEIAEVIQVALEERLSYSTPRGGERFFSYVLLKTLEITDDGIIRAYVYVKDSEYYVDHGELKEGGSSAIPAVVVMEEKENGWRVEVDTPEAGRWGPSIREIFPEEVWPLIFHSPPVPYETIDENIIQQAEEHFGLIFDPDKNSLSPKDNMATPSVRILTLTPTPTLDLSTLELDVSGRVYIGDEYVSIVVDLYPKVARPFYKGLLSSDWQVYLYRRRADNNYSAQNALVLDEIKESTSRYEFNVRTPLEELRIKFDDNRGFIYQVVDKTGEVFFQDEFYINHNLTNQYQDNSQKVFPDGYPDYVDEGLIIGFPNLLSNKIAPLFLTDENMITIKEPQGGFYALYFEYGFAAATGVTGSNELQKLSENLVVELFPYQEDGFYNDQEATMLPGKISGVSGVLQASFPHEWLDKVRDNEQNLYLRVANEDGNIYKEVYLHCIPYVP